MKMHFRFLLFFLLVSLLTGCYNRIRDYQPYSEFDEHMAAASSAEDRMPSLTQDPYAETDQAYAEPMNDGYNDQFNEPAPAPSIKRYTREAAPRAIENVGGGDAAEVPFDTTRRVKPSNIGAL